MANSLRMIDGSYLMKIQRGRQGGRDYTLLPQLRPGIRKNAKRPQFQSTEYCSTKSSHRVYQEKYQNY